MRKTRRNKLTKLFVVKAIKFWGNENIAKHINNDIDSISLDEHISWGEGCFQRVKLDTAGFNEIMYPCLDELEIDIIKFNYSSAREYFFDLFGKIGNGVFDCRKDETLRILKKVIK